MPDVFESYAGVIKKANVGSDKKAKNATNFMLYGMVLLGVALVMKYVFHIHQLP